MTCIVGVAHEGQVYLGGDSAGVSGYSLTVRADAEVFRNGPYVLGFTSSFRMGQLLRYSLKPPAPTVDLEAFMVTTFVDAVRACLKAGGYASKTHEVEEGGTFLVGVRGRLFRVDSDYQVGEAGAGYDAIGCGEDLAFGALYATGHLQPRRRVRVALEAAEAGSGGVRAPFLVISGGKAA